MPKEDKLREKAQKILDYAESLLDDDRHEKAAKEFIKAAEGYFRLKEYLIAEQCHFYASKSLIHEEKFLQGSEAMRNSANCCILENNYEKAGQYYDISAKYALKSKKRNAESQSILSACFAYLCLFLKGQQEKGLAFIKRIKQKVDSKEFLEHNLVRLVKALTLAILNRDESALQLIEEEFVHFKFRESETKLIKDSLLLAKTHLLLDFNLKMEAENKEILNNTILKYTLNIDFSDLKELENDGFLNYKFNSIKILDIGTTISDNLSIKNKPQLPLTVKTEEINLEFEARTNFQGEGFIGPLVFTIELDERLYFFAKTKSYKILVKSPPASLGINLKPMINPIINQTFPMEITINNPSDSDVVNIVIELEFPKSLRLMRGTNAKKIYQLIRNEDIKWQISLKPLEPGNHIIKATVTFNDQDGKQIGPNTADLPFEINL